MCTHDANCSLRSFFFSCAAIKFDYETHIIYYFCEERERERGKKKRKKCHTNTQRTRHGKHKTNTISTAFTIEAVVISEVFTFGVLSQWAENVYGKPYVRERERENVCGTVHCFNADTDSFLFIDSIIIVCCECCTRAWVCVCVCVLHTLILDGGVSNVQLGRQGVVCNEMAMQLVINYKMCVPFWRVISVCRQIYFVYDIRNGDGCPNGLVLLKPLTKQLTGANGNLGHRNCHFSKLQMPSNVRNFICSFHFLFFLSLIQFIHFFFSARQRKKSTSMHFFFVFSFVDWANGYSFVPNKKI